jgi:hypothetical protein
MQAPRAYALDVIFWVCRPKDESFTFNARILIGWGQQWGATLEVAIRFSIYYQVFIGAIR